MAFVIDVYARRIVGWRVIEYPASEEITRALVETIPTVAQATTGTVQSCWAT